MFIHLLLFFVHMLQGHIAKQPMAEYVTLLKYISNMFQSSVIRADSLYPDKWSIV